MLSLDLASLRAAYSAGQLTPTSLVEELWRRLETHGDPALWIWRVPREELFAYAKRIEAKGASRLPLYGVPFAIKDNIDLAGAPTTAACPEFAFTAQQSAAVVQRLIDAGAIPVGKTNLDQFATGLVGVRSPYGTPRNPFRADMIPGGSSSGSAVAVAAGLASFSLGTDTAGSGRVPAGLNNLVGLKPTRGALSTRGVFPACRTLDCVSIFALTCEDAADVVRVAEGYDDRDAYSRNRSSPQRPPAAGALRVGIPPQSALSFFGDEVAAKLFDAARHRISALGLTAVEIDFAPFQEVAALLYQGPWVAERWAVLSQFHGRHAEAFHPVVRTIVEGARMLSAADAFAGQYRLAELARRCQAQWEKMDALLLPTAPRPYTVAEVLADPIVTNSRLGTYTNFVNLLDLSGVAVPAGIRPDGVPWGVTFLAPAWHEPSLLELGRKWHADVGGNLGATPIAYRSDPSRVPPASMTAVRLAVVGAHLSGLPLNHQLTDRGARLVWSGKTAPEYRLFALPGTTPPKPGLMRAHEGGAGIAVEVWELDETAFGSFVAAVPPPLAIGSVRLENGEWVKGFLCEAVATAGAEEITAHGGWRAFLGRGR